MEMQERREFERKPLQLEAKYEINYKEFPCYIIDISLQGMGIRVNDPLKVGVSVKILIEQQVISGRVIRVEGNIAGIRYDLLKSKQLDYISEIKQITDIADRALKKDPMVSASKADLIKDIENCHRNGCHLDLDKLIKFNDSDFTYDICGILLNLNRITGKLENSFLPKSAKTIK